MKVTYNIDLMIIKDRTLGEIESICYIVNGKGGGKNAGIDQKVSIAALYLWKELKPYKVYAKGKELTVSEFYGLRNAIQREFIHMHRLNYMAYRTVQDVYDWLDDSNLLNYNVKGYWKKIERTFDTYLKLHRAKTDQPTWALVQDHVRLASDEIRPLIPELEVSIRDYLIAHRRFLQAAFQKDDVTLLTKVQTGLMFCAALRNTRKNFFADVIKKYGVDFSSDFTYADITPIGRNFVSMAEQLGVKFSTDKDGDYILKGVIVDNSVRVDAAWNNIVKIVTDDELMDKLVLKAINMNPEAKKDYEATVAREEEKTLEEAMGNLSSKFKVTKL